MPDTFTTRHEQLISGQTRTPSASLARLGLRGLAGVYGLGVRIRNLLFDAGLRRVHRVPVPVISVGNLTVGGTGKTPLVIQLCEHLAGQGLKVGVLARGYGSTGDALNDELRLITQRCPGVICQARPDRVAGARRLLEQYDLDVILLDDGFQHRRLARDLDIVTLDATCPFGHGNLLPRGLLREPTSALVRARLIIINHADRLDATTGAELISHLQRLSPSADILSARTRARGLVSLDGSPAVANLAAGARVGSVCSIARPAHFVATVRELGYAVLDCQAWPDHHQYSRADVGDIAKWAERLNPDALLTTEKDAVKLAAWSEALPCPIWAVRISVDIPDRDATMLQAWIDRCLHTEGTTHAHRRTQATLIDDE